jgi:hypothetical protein
LDPGAAVAVVVDREGPVDGRDRYTNFLLSTSADTSYKNLFLDLDDVVSELELHIADVPDAPGYQASDWLRFPVPLSNASVGGAVDLEAGQVNVPIPLRAFPLLPSVKSLRRSRRGRASTCRRRSTRRSSGSSSRRSSTRVRRRTRCS